MNEYPLKYQITPNGVKVELKIRGVNNRVLRRELSRTVKRKGRIEQRLQP